MEQMKGGGAKGIYIVTSQEPSPIVRAIKNVVRAPSCIFYARRFQGPQAVSAAKATPDSPPSYVQFGALPFELADQYPVLKQTQNIVKDAVSNPKLTSFTLSAFNAWTLFASSASACGDNFTSDCILQKAKAHTDWTAGGLYPPQNIQTGKASPCIAIVKLTPTGFIYDKTVTAPTQGAFNCDPENLKQVK